MVYRNSCFKGFIRAPHQGCSCAASRLLVRRITVTHAAHHECSCGASPLLVSLTGKVDDRHQLLRNKKSAFFFSIFCSIQLAFTSSLLCCNALLVVDAEVKTSFTSFHFQFTPMPLAVGQGDGSIWTK